jgi:mono/diheme cytochrome c family protein
MVMKDLLIGLFLLTCPAAIFAVFGASGLEAFDDTASAKPSIRDVEDGRIAYVKACAGCHGRAALGSARGPSLMKTAIAGQGLDRPGPRKHVLVRPASGAECPGLADITEMPDRDLDSIVAFLAEMHRIGSRP